MKKQIAIVAVGLSIALSSATAFVAFAENNGNNELRGPEKAISELEKKLDNIDAKENRADKTRQSVVINPNGNFKLTGVKVVAISGSSLTGSLYGKSLTRDVSGAKIIGAGTSSTLADIKVGDILVVAGQLTSDGVVTITEIHDVSTPNNSAVEAIKARIQELLKKLTDLQNRLLNR